MKFTEIKISGLKDGSHSYHFDLDKRFLADFSSEFFENPNVSLDVELLLSETMIKSQVKIEGKVELICDRSLDSFEHPVSLEAVHFFKFGEEEKELSDELEVILKERVSIDFDQMVYDFIALSLPSKKLHPRFQALESSEETEGEIIFSTSSETENTSESEIIDPRWAKLKELND